jgi:hypothetical protein
MTLLGLLDFFLDMARIIRTTLPGET